ncbi:restriction endonuclease subunit S [Enterococcus faecalis]|uniref:restriction endonuclease subunit S n=1 Tax=Enterococcus faecalis TaxID=1351 RepID=UPI00223507D7|nr:restriction endonuclease subunit S [Enterococcus faecalis]
MIVFTLIGVWELCKLGEVFDFKQGVQVPVEEQFTTLEEGMQRFIRIVDLTTDEEPPRYIKYDSDNLVSESDLFMVRYGAVGVIGLGYEGVIANNLFKLIPRIVVDEKFSYHQLIKNKDKIISLSSSTTMPALSFKTLKNLSFSVSSVDEQKQIGSFFANLDNLITLHQRKLEQLKELKKAYLQLLLAQTNESKPKVRLANFEEDWQLCKVGEIFNVTRGNVLSANHVSLLQNEKNPYPVYSSQTKNNGLMGYYDDYLFDTAITWTTDGANAGTVKFRDGKFYSTNVNGVLLSECGYANQLIAEILNKVAWKHVSRVGNPKLMNNTMSEILIKIPTHLEEQKELAEIFLKLDKKTTILEHKVNQMKILKKSYLQNMFI